jgi:hypothetical protein
MQKGDVTVWWCGKKALTGQGLRVHTQFDRENHTTLASQQGRQRFKDSKIAISNFTTNQPLPYF